MYRVHHGRSNPSRSALLCPAWRSILYRVVEVVNAKTPRLLFPRISERQTRAIGRTKVITWPAMLPAPIIECGEEEGRTLLVAINVKELASHIFNLASLLVSHRHAIIRHHQRRSSTYNAEQPAQITQTYTNTPADKGLTSFKCLHKQLLDLE